MTKALMNQTEYAAHRGVGKSAVSNWKKKDLLVFRDGKVDVAATDRVLAHAIDPGRGRPANGELPTEAGNTASIDTPSSEPSASSLPPSSQEDGSDEPATQPGADGQFKLNFNIERAREIYEKRVGQALKNARDSGELVPVDAAASKLESAVTGFCERMGSEFRGKAEQLALESDVRSVRAIVDEIIDTVRADFAARYESMIEGEE